MKLSVIRGRPIKALWVISVGLGISEARVLTTVATEAQTS